MKVSLITGLRDRDEWTLSTDDGQRASSYTASRGERWDTDDRGMAREVERLMIDYSFAWEGYVEWVTDRPDITARWNGYSGFAGCMRFDAANCDRQISEVLLDLERDRRSYTWVVNPDSTPIELIRRLEGHGYGRAVQWDGLVLDDLSVDLGLYGGVEVEALSDRNALAYSAFLRLLSHGRMSRLEALACVQRYLTINTKEVQIFLARINGRVAGFAVLRVEPNGLAYLRQAGTLPEFRHRGVYLSLLGHRLSLARDMGCTVVLVQAMTATSAPILRKRGFRKVCALSGYARTAENAANGDNRKLSMQ